ncbi:uncharacterized protein [Palaemon carinicauda]|uniref:uncharacterized protein n=1 Tax=Palaemon carinicauda TaxID=392227 RepID=UPI0035B62300
MIPILCVIALLGALGIDAQDAYHHVNGTSARTPEILKRLISSLEKREALENNESISIDGKMENAPTDNVRRNEENGRDFHLLTGSPMDKDPNENEATENPNASINDVTGVPKDTVNNNQEIPHSTESISHTEDVTVKPTNDKVDNKEIHFITDSVSHTEHITGKPNDAIFPDTLDGETNTRTYISVTTPVPTQDENKAKENDVTEAIQNTLGDRSETELLDDIPNTTTFYDRPHSIGDHERTLNSSYHSLDTEILRTDNDPHSHLPRAERHEEEEDTSARNAPAGNTTNLCLSCLCDPGKKNVYCKHEHMIHGSTFHQMDLHKGMIPKTATYLSIEGFERVKIMRGAFDSEDLELRNIQFQNIPNVQFVKESLLFNAKARSNREVAITFNNCTIEEIPTETFTQYARSEDQNNDIDLENTRFLSLHIIRCNISKIRSYALTQARLLNFKMSHSKVETMEEHSFHLDVYEDWTMEHNKLPHLMPHTICLRSQMLVIFSHNEFAAIENRSMEITSNSQVLFEFNHVFYLGSEALMGITPKGRGSNLVFMNNTVVGLAPKSLLISNRYPIHERKILDNNFNILCDCEVKQKFQPFFNINQLSSHQDNMTFNKLIASSSCRKYTVSSIYSNIDVYLADNCAPIPLPIIISAAVVVTVVIITIIVCIVCTKRAEKAKEEANYLGECCYSHSFSTLNSGNPTASSPFTEFSSIERAKQIQPWVLAVPEVKTYQETEVNVRYEHTDTLKASVRGSCQDPIIDFQQRAGVRGSCPFN